MPSLVASPQIPSVAKSPMSRVSISRALQSCQLKQQQWSSLLGITPTDFLLAAITLFALLIFLCVA